MLQLGQSFSANDNAPTRAPILKNRSARLIAFSAPDTSNQITEHQRKAATAWVIPVMAMLFGVFAVWQNIPLINLLWPSAVIVTLLLFITMQAEVDSPLRNFSGLLMVAAFTTGLSAFLAQNGFSLLAMELTLLVSMMALLIGWLFQSKPPVLLSAFAALLYLTSYFPDLAIMSGLTEQISFLGAGLLPWVILGQILLAQRMQSAVVLLASLMAGYIWLLTLAHDIPSSALMGLGFTIAAAHYSLGKAWDEAGKFGANTHRTFAWIIALGAALYTQSVWLNVDGGQAKPFWSPNTLWFTILGAAMFVLFVTSLMRYKTSHVSLVGIFIICAAVLVVPAAAIKPDLVHTVFDNIPGLDARPGLGLVIGAFILASGFTWIIGGLLNGQILNMVLGTIAIGVESLMLFQTSRFDTDLGVIFVFSLIFALCIGGLVAGATPERTESLKTLA